MLQKSSNSLVHQAPESRSSRIGNYGDLAAEYYDPQRHPTCADFGRASQVLLARLLAGSNYSTNGLTLEIGAGKSALAQVLVQLGDSLTNIILSDVSAKMLMYSMAYKSCGASFLVANGENLPLEPGSLATLVCVLGDPYNTSKFWEEAARVTRLGGKVIYLCPSHIWAEAFRERDPFEVPDAARFLKSDGDPVYVPSKIYPPLEQARMVESFGFQERLSLFQGKDSLNSTISPKLVHLDASDPVVEGFVFERRASSLRT